MKCLHSFEQGGNFYVFLEIQSGSTWDLKIKQVLEEKNSSIHVYYFIVLFCFRKPVQNIPIPVIYPEEHNQGIWGGEGVVKGFQKRNPTSRRVPHFWFPQLFREVVYSEILDKHMSLIVTRRTMQLIHENYGFDYYLLKVFI